MEDFPGRVALVTGASGRLGGVLVQTLAAAGWRVLAHAHRHPGRVPGAAAEVFALDLAGAGAGAALFARALARAGRVDLLVHAASEYPEGDLDALDEARLQRLLALGVAAPLALTQALARHARTRPPSGRPDGDGDPNVVHLLDARLHDRVPSRGGYLLGKGAEAALMEASARAFAPTLRVNAVAPGALTFDGGPDGGAAGFDVPAATAAAPLGRLASAREAAEAVAWLAGARSVTGQVVYVDGGRHLHRGAAIRASADRVPRGRIENTP